MSKEEIYNILRETFHSQSGLFLNKEQCMSLATIIFFLKSNNQNKDE